MPDFSYVARNLQGEKVSGSISAASELSIFLNQSAKPTIGDNVPKYFTSGSSS